jgi:ABC-type glycerol-3-phosphate transport system substrate-binding protein
LEISTLGDYYYDEDIFEQLDLEIPDTWKELLHVAQICGE